MTRTKNTYLALLAVLLSPIAANADVIEVDIDRDLNGSAFQNLGAPVFIANGDSVVLNIQFLDDLAVTILDGAEYMRVWLLSNDNDSTFTIDNIVFELLGFSGTGGAASVYNFGSQSSGQAHIGPVGQGFLSVGQSVTFSGLRVSYNVSSIAVSPQDYFSSFIDFGQNVSVGPASVPEPGTLALLGIGLLGMGLSRRRKKA